MATKAERAKVERLAEMLKKAAKLADEIGATLGNGGEVGSIVGAMAAEIDVRAEEIADEYHEQRERTRDAQSF